MACKPNCKMVKSANLLFTHWAFPSGCAIMWMLIETHTVSVKEEEYVQLKDAEGVTERLKAENQMEWVGRMNSIRSRAEEIILSELVYC